jgi:hypothetical protein
MAQPFDPLDVLGDAKAAPSFPLSDRELREEQQEQTRRLPRGGPGDLVCASCGSLTKGKTVAPGSFGLELLLWLFLLLPGILYSAWRLTAKYRGCEFCGGRELVPAATPRGRQLLEQYRS